MRSQYEKRSRLPYRPQFHLAGPTIYKINTLRVRRILFSGIAEGQLTVEILWVSQLKHC